MRNLINILIAHIILISFTQVKIVVTIMGAGMATTGLIGVVLKAVFGDSGGSVNILLMYPTLIKDMILLVFTNTIEIPYQDIIYLDNTDNTINTSIIFKHTRDESDSDIPTNDSGIQTGIHTNDSDTELNTDNSNSVDLNNDNNNPVDQNNADDTRRPAESSPERISREEYEETTQTPQNIEDTDLEDTIIRLDEKLHYYDESTEEERKIYIARKEELVKELTNRREEQNITRGDEIEAEPSTERERQIKAWKDTAKRLEIENEDELEKLGEERGLNIRGTHICNGCIDCKPETNN